MDLGTAIRTGVRSWLNHGAAALGTEPGTGRCLRAVFRTAGSARGGFQESIYPASGNNELVLAYLLEISFGRMSKAQVLGRYRCVIDPFEPADIGALGLPAMIIEASNDPLVEKTLREQLKKTYPSARVETMGDVGHFSYLNQAQEYTALLREFLREPAR